MKKKKKKLINFALSKILMYTGIFFLQNMAYFWNLPINLVNFYLHPKHIVVCLASIINMENVFIEYHKFKLSLLIN